MVVSVDLEKKFFHLILHNLDYLKKVEYGFFQNTDISEIFKYAKFLKLKYPDSKLGADILYLAAKKKNRHDILTREKIDIVWAAGQEEYDREWYQKALESWIAYKSLESAFVEGATYFKSQNIDNENALQVCNDTLNLINSRGFVSFHHSAGLDFLNPDSHIYNEEFDRKPLGVEYFDKVTGGGLSKGELCVFMGESNIGKSIWLANIAKWSLEQGHNVLYVSCEMKKEKVIRRIGSNAFDIPMKEYFDVMSDPDNRKRILTEYKSRNNIFNDSKPLGNLIIEQFSSGTLTVPMLKNFILDKIQNTYNVKIDVLVVDYVNIMSNFRNPNTENTYMKIKQLTEDLRALAGDLDIATYTATQLKIGAYGVSDLNLSDASESKGLGETADIVFGIIQDLTLKPQRKYRIKTVKNRDEGYKDSKQIFDINYNFMKITQGSEPMTGVIEDV